MKMKGIVKISEDRQKTRVKRNNNFNPQERLICDRHGVVAHVLKEIAGWAVCVAKPKGIKFGFRWVTHPDKPEGCYLCKAESGESYE